MGQGKGGMFWENGIEAYILSYVKRITSPGSMHETGSSGLVHWDDPEGWDGEGGGRWVHDGEHMCRRDGFMSMYGKITTILQNNWPPIKINKLIFKIFFLKLPKRNL